MVEVHAVKESTTNNIEGLVKLEEEINGVAKSMYSVKKDE